MGPGRSESRDQARSAPRMIRAVPRHRNRTNPVLPMWSQPQPGACTHAMLRQGTGGQSRAAGVTHMFTTNKRARQTIALAVATAGAAALLTGCSSERNRLAEFRSDPTPDLVTMNERPRRRQEPQRAHQRRVQAHALPRLALRLVHGPPDKADPRAQRLVNLVPNCITYESRRHMPPAFSFGQNALHTLKGRRLYCHYACCEGQSPRRN